MLTFTIHHAGMIVVSLITGKAKNKTANEVLYSTYNMRGYSKNTIPNNDDKVCKAIESAVAYLSANHGFSFTSNDSFLISLIWDFSWNSC